MQDVFVVSAVRTPIGKQKGVDKAGLDPKDIDIYEINEAFAPIPLAWAKETNAEMEKLNVNEGAFARYKGGGREGPAGYGFFPGAYLPTRLHLPCHAAQRAQSYVHHLPVLIPAAAPDLSQYRHPLRGSRSGHGPCRLYGTGENENPILENKDIRAMEEI